MSYANRLMGAIVFWLIQAHLEFIVGLVEDVCVRLIESSTTSINKIEVMIEVLVSNF
ncbi:MAG: hypothetical protein H6910_02390 [Rickettsiaceae bacterium]|jgi:hypothetical protein|nr:hypothetical protein [Rickettsiaceae bacterium]MCP5377949.1 hypothetical protein [Rickettsiaceae bacterium]